MNIQISTKHSDRQSAAGTRDNKHTGVQQLRRAKRVEIRWFKLVACIWCLVFLLLTANESMANDINANVENDTANALANQLLNAPAPVVTSGRQIKAISGYKRELHSTDNTGVETLSENAKRQLLATELLPTVAKMTRADHQAKKSLAQLPSSKQQSKQKIEVKAARSFRQEFSIFDGFTQLFDDIDADGFFRTFSVTFDADVYTYNGVNEALVYADIYLRRDGGAWEYFYTTDDFLIVGESTADEYQVLSTLATGYQPDHYDVLIDLYQVGYSDIVATYSSDESSSLYALPLESENFDIYYEEEIHVHGGSLNWQGLIILVFLPLLRSSLSVAK
ncbi:hypothetical protein DXX93_06590 [Thalassotalea euphylliae]|uniref:GlyGly-CTERM sorting domain-containing protein n=2 Tax=Thalassotalea euphylliae TaxID=1655234 RepID=A0A3E0TPC1_9GAMM|nr:hypothetical protein DXX93_06590 [Thalassotalea euphylliae]